ncbi:DUF4397 domain-containing protein [Marinobacter salinisoli]|uniref:DUF4397 domain-containing protein n=1 Tax=Marinobacter salinisoli TaxID=2769486 RepID=A0ABX7MW34_9GAMM|nr:DUF4397 domain-containing protein [Marinobacter salinisoli]QSP96349.1 DUF4397 domain-containing protein [Marinobacter salinisoli]
MEMTRVLPLLLAGTVALSGCFFEEDDPSKSYVRVIHASSDAPPVDVRLGRSFEREGLDYKQAVRFIPNAGTAQLSINADLPGSARETILTSSYSFRQDTRYDFIAAGRVADGSIKPILLADNEELEIGASVRLRVVHLSPDAQAVSRNVDIYLSEVDDDDWLAAGPAFRLGLQDVEGPTQVSGGQYKIRVARAGTADVVFESRGLSLPEGSDLLIAAVDNTAVSNSAGSAGRSPVSLMVINDDDVSDVYDVNQRSGLRVVHGSPGAPPVDVFANDQQAVSELAFASVAPSAERDSYATVAPGTQNVTVTVAGDRSRELISESLSLGTGEGKTVIAYDRPGVVKSLVLDDSVRSIASQASLRVVHGSRVAGIAGPVNIYLLPEDRTNVSSAVPILRDVPFGTESGYLAITPENYNLFVRDADGNVRIGPVLIGLRAGGIHTFFVTDTAAGDRALLIELDDNPAPLP